MSRSLFSTWSQILRLLSPQDRLVLGGLLVMMMVGAAFEAVGISAIPAYIALLESPDRALTTKAGSWAYSLLDFESPGQFVFWFGIALLVFFIIKNAYLTWLTYARVSFVRQQGVVMSSRLFRAYLYAPYPFITSTNSADLQRNVNGEVNKVVGSVLFPGLKMLMELIVTLAVIGVLVIAEPLLSFLVLVVLGLIGAGFSMAIKRRMRRYAKQQQIIRGMNIRFIQQGLGSLVDARILGRTEFFAKAHRRTMEAFARTTAFKQLIADLPSRIFETTMVLGILLIGIIFTVQARDPGSLLPTLALFGIASIRLIPAASRITGALTEIRFYYPSADLVFRDLSRFEPTTPTKADAKVMPEPLVLQDEVAFDRVSFRYPEAEKEALRDVSFHIPRGHAVGIVGSSGAGKSTLAALFLGLLEPTGGRILIDGESLDGQVNRWRRNIGYVSQRVYLGDDTLRANVALGVPTKEVDEAAVWHALKLAQLDEFVRGLPSGLDTNVGEAGARLSGGQRQRIAIARALYTDPQVLLFDEATAALDNRTEQGLIEAIERLRGDRTVITIAHRLSTVRSCDRLFVFSEGELVDAGTYDELLENSAPFQAIAVHG